MTALTGRHAVVRQWQGRYAWHPAARTTLMIVADQGLNSATNVVMLLIVAAALPLSAFGMFAIVAVTVQLGQMTIGAALGDRLLQAPADRRGPRYATGRRILVGATLVTGAVLIASLIVTGLVGASPSIWLAAVAVLPALAVTDQWRVHVAGRQRPGAALTVDVVLGSLQIAAVGGWYALGTPGGASGAVLAWWLAAWLAAALPRWPGWEKRDPGVTGRGERAGRRETVSLRYGLETGAVNGAGQLAQLVVAGQLGLMFAGTLRAAQIPFGLLVVAVLAARPIVITTIRDSSPDRSRRVLLAVGLSVVGLAAVVSGLTIALTQTPSLRFLIGGVTLPNTYVLLLGAGYAAFGVATVQVYGARAAGRDGEVTIGRVVLLAGLAGGAVATWIADSVWVFLISLVVAWTASSVTMLATGRRHSDAVAPAETDPGGNNAPRRAAGGPMRRLANLVVFGLPATAAKNRLLRLLGHDVDRSARLGALLVVDVGHFIAGAEARVGSFNVFRALQRVELGEGSFIGQLNWFSSAPMFEQLSSECGTLRLADHAAVVSRHHVDCSGGVSLGRFAVVAGLGSIVLTHEVDHLSGRQTCAPVEIQEYAMLNCANRMVAGAVLPARSLTGIGSIVLPGLTEPDSLYAGSPARRIKSVQGSAFFSRTERAATL